MILFTIVLIITYIIYLRIYDGSWILPISIFFFALLLFFSFVTESYFNTSVDYFVSDELSYWNQSLDHEYNELDRYVWNTINLVQKEYDFGGVLSIKIFSILFLMLFLLLLWLNFNKNNNIFVLPFVFPYLTWLSTKNLRDIIILLFIALSIHLWFKKGAVKFFCILPLILLFFTRPLMSIITIIVLLAITFWPNVKNVFKKYDGRVYFSFRKLAIVISALSAIIVISNIPFVESRINSFFLQFKFVIGEGYLLHLTLAEGINTGYIITDLIVGAVRYVFTPIPTSIFNRFIEGGTEWGIIDDWLRFLTQTIFYGFLFYSILNYKKIRINFAKLQNSSKSILIVLMLHLPIYTLYMFGGGHQRTKIPFQIAIFLLYIISLNKTKNQNEVRCLNDN